MEDTMLKCSLSCVTLLAFAIGSVNAQEREAVLRKVDVPGGSFDIVLATPKSPAAVVYHFDADALIVHLIGGKLALAFEDTGKMIDTLDSLQLPACSFQIESRDRKLHPVAMYVVPKGG
jgi:hypothetical protein